MLQDAAHYWWLMLLRGIAAFAFGILALIWPSMTWLVLLTYYAVYCILEGILALGLGVSGGKGHRVWGQMLLVGFLGLGAGIVIVLWPKLTTYALLVIIASWAIARGIVEIVAAVRIRNEVQGEWILALDGVISIALGSVLLAHPTLGLPTVLWMIIAFAIATGILLILFSIKLHHLKQHPAEDMHHAAGH